MALLSRLLECMMKNINIISIILRIHSRLYVYNTYFEWLENPSANESML